MKQVKWSKLTDGMWSVTDINGKQWTVMYNQHLPARGRWVLYSGPRMKYVGTFASKAKAQAAASVGKE